MKRNVKIVAALLACGVAAVALFSFSAIRIAEGTEIGAYGPYGILMRKMERASALRVPDFSLNCEAETFAKGGLPAKLGTSINIIFWSMKARSYERDFARYESLGQEKLASLAATQGIEHWSDVAYGQKELECYEVAALSVRNPVAGNKARHAAEAAAREAAAQEAAYAVAIQEQASAAAAAADAAAAAAEAAAAAAEKVE